MPVIVVVANLIVNAFAMEKSTLSYAHVCLCVCACEYKIATSYGGSVDFSMVFAIIISNEQKKTWNRMLLLVCVCTL